MDDTLIRERTLPRMRDIKTIGTRTQSAAAVDQSRSFEEIFLEHWGMIYQVLQRMIGDPAEAEDLTLEVFYRLYRHQPKNGDGSNLKGWLFRVATNLGLRSIRSYQRRIRYELAAGKMTIEALPPNQPVEILDKNETNEITRLVLSRMQPRQARLLTLRYSGLAYKEIANALDVAPTSIGPLLLRAERQFARIYDSLTREEK